jgi:hypothetical protein
MMDLWIYAVGTGVAFTVGAVSIRMPLGYWLFVGLTTLTIIAGAYHTVSVMRDFPKNWSRESLFWFFEAKLLLIQLAILMGWSVLLFVRRLRWYYAVLAMLSGALLGCYINAGIRVTRQVDAAIRVMAGS